MRGLLWIAAIALLGCGALFLAWRLLPPEAREGALPEATGDSPPAASEPGHGLQPVQPVAANQRSITGDPAPSAAPAVEAPVAGGIEDGGLAQAARPLPDFSARYPGALRPDLLIAAGTLERGIADQRKQLTRAEAADLDARLANQPRAGEPTPRVAALLAQIDELAWLRQRLASSPADDR
jgi:hypothetical protein